MAKIPVIILIVVIMGGYLYFRNVGSENLDVEMVSPEGLISLDELKPDYRIWLNYWSGDQTILCIDNSQSKISQWSPLWYVLSKEGKLETYTVIKQKEIEQKLIDRNIVPTVGNDFDAKRVKKILDSEELQKNFINRLIKLAIEKKYNGWDLDWEQIDSDDQVRYGNFVREIKGEFEKYNLKIYVTVHARTGDASDWVGARGHNLELLATADEIRVMAYDYHSAVSDPGPTTPSKWLEEVIKYNQKFISNEKLVLGLPLYGYDWKKNGEGVPIVYKEAIVMQKEWEFEWIPQDMKTWQGKYIKDGYQHEIWIENSLSVIEKVKLGQDMGINKFIFWSGGGEDAQLWKMLP